VIIAWKATVTVGATRAEVVRAAAASTEEATVVRERVVALIKLVEARATLAEGEARVRVSKAEVESTILVASARGEATGFAQKVAHMEGELTDAR
jgi:hypothetical protein